MTSSLQSDFRARNGSVDAMRLLAAAGIVWFHADAWGRTVSYAALSLFIVFLIVLPLQRPWSGSFSGYTWERAKRLLRPWFVWSLIYAILKIFQAIFQQKPVMTEFNWTMIVMGTMPHLWFLPFGFVCSIAALWLTRWLNGRSDFAFVVLVLLASICVPASTVAISRDLLAPLAEWCYGLPAVLFALAIHFANLDPRKLFYVGIATVVGLLLTIATTDQVLGAVSLLIGINSAILVFAIPTVPRSWTRWAAGVSMPVYLVHPIFLSLLEGKTGFENGAILATAAILLSMALGSLIFRLRWARWLT